MWIFLKILIPLFLDIPVCKDFFLWLNSVGDSRLKALIKTYKAQQGAHPREFHYKGGYTSGLKWSDCERIVKFIQNIAEIHSLALPGRVPGKIVPMISAYIHRSVEGRRL